MLPNSRQKIIRGTGRILFDTQTGYHIALAESQYRGTKHLMMVAFEETEKEITADAVHPIEEEDVGNKMRMGHLIDVADARYDPEADVLHLISDLGEVARSEEVAPGTAVGFDDTGSVIGVEILRVPRVLVEKAVASLHARQAGVSYPRSSHFPSARSRNFRPRQVTVLPKKPLTQKANEVKSCTGANHHSRAVSGSCSTQPATAHAATARIAVASASNGHKPGSNATSSNATGNGFVKTSPM
jgi:uncharacterized protein YuzE